MLSRGERLIRSGRDKRLASDHSITIRGSAWFDHSKDHGGRAIDFVREYYGLSFQDAVKELIGCQSIDLATQRKEEPEKKAFALPPPNSEMRRVFAYLVYQRCIPRNIVAEFAHRKLLYEDAQHHSAVFVGYDQEGYPRHAHCRSTCSYKAPFRINVEGCDSAYSFHFIGTGKDLYVFEAPIDMLSYIALIGPEWKENSYVALCGTSRNALMRTLTENPQLTKITFCLDNDQAGISATNRLIQECNELGFSTSTDFPVHKDWNEDLCSLAENNMVME